MRSIGLSLRNFCSANKKYIVGVNLYENPKNIYMGIIDLSGNVFEKRKIECDMINFSDERYITGKRQLKIKELCKNLIKMLIYIHIISFTGKIVRQYTCKGCLYDLY